MSITATVLIALVCFVAGFRHGAYHVARKLMGGLDGALEEQRRAVALLEEEIRGLDAEIVRLQARRAR